MGFSGAGAGLAKVAATPVAGFPLQNGTPTILTWVAPNDGNQHRVALFGSLHCTSTGTGGQVNVSWTSPDGTTGAHTFYSANQAAGSSIQPGGSYTIIVQAGSTVSIVQGTALTAGAVTLWAEMWGSLCVNAVTASRRTSITGRVRIAVCVLRVSAGTTVRHDHPE